MKVENLLYIKEVLVSLRQQRLKHTPKMVHNIKFTNFREKSTNSFIICLPVANSFSPGRIMTNCKAYTILSFSKVNVIYFTCWNLCIIITKYSNNLNKPRLPSKSYHIPYNRYLLPIWNLIMLLEFISAILRLCFNTQLLLSPLVSLK